MKHTLEIEIDDRVVDGNHPFCGMNCPQLDLRAGAYCELFNEILDEVGEETIERDCECMVTTGEK